MGEGGSRVSVEGVGGWQGAPRGAPPWMLKGAAGVLAARLPDELAHLVVAHGAAAVLQRHARRRIRARRALRYIASFALARVGGT